MGYEDRDYFKAKPKFEMSLGMPSGTKALLMAVVAAYVVMVVSTDVVDLTSPDAAGFFAGQQGRFALETFVLWPGNIFPFHPFADLMPWKVLVSWMFPPTMLGALLSALMVYVSGKMLEDVFGTKRYLTLFIGAAIGGNLLACLIDPFIVGGRMSLVMGPTAGIFAVLATMIWIAPNERSAFGIRMKSITIGLIVIFGGMGLLRGATGDSSVVSSPTQLLFGAALGAVYMMFLKSRGKVPAFAKGATVNQSEASQGMRKYEEAAAAQAIEEERHQAELSKQKVKGKKDTAEIERILEKISANGIDSLSRKEKKFLDEQSKSKRGR